MKVDAAVSWVAFQVPQDSLLFLLLWTDRVSSLEEQLCFTCRQLFLASACLINNNVLLCFVLPSLTSS